MAVTYVRDILCFNKCMEVFLQNTFPIWRALASFGARAPFFALFYRLRRNDEGVTAIEFAFVVPVFLLFLSAIINFGVAYFIKSHMQDVARDVTRRVAVGEMTEEQAEKFAHDGLLNSASSYNTAGSGGGLGDKNTLDSQLSASAPSSDSNPPSGGSKGAGISYSVDVIPPGPTGKDVTTVISAPLRDVSLFDFLGLLQNGNIQVSVTMRME